MENCPKKQQSDSTSEKMLNDNALLIKHEN